MRIFQSFTEIMAMATAMQIGLFIAAIIGLAIYTYGLITSLNDEYKRSDGGFITPRPIQTKASKFSTIMMGIGIVMIAIPMTIALFI